MRGLPARPCGPESRAPAPVVHAIRPRRPAQTDDPLPIAAACGGRPITPLRPWRRTPTAARPTRDTRAPPAGADVAIAPAPDGGAPPPGRRPSEFSRAPPRPPRLGPPGAV